MSGKRKKRCQHEMIVNMLEVLDEGMNKNQIRLATGLGGQQVNALVKEAMNNGLLEWTGEALRTTRGENYGQKLRATERGNCWLKLWRLLIRVGDPTSRIRVTIKKMGGKFVET